MKRKPFVPAQHLTKLWRVLIEFDMLHAGDRILVGLSGGKDSLFLTAALAEIRHYAPVPFELACYTMDARFDEHFPKAELEAFCARLGVPHYSEPVDILKIWNGGTDTRLPAGAEDEADADDTALTDAVGVSASGAGAAPALPRLKAARRGNTPCFTCAYFRRAATNRFARTHGFNKVAWAHHHDDAVATFALNLFQSGQLKTFLPVTHLSRSGITLIRPLLYYREAEIRQLVRELGFTPIKNPCKFDGFTERTHMQELIARWEQEVPGLYDHLAAAMRLPVGGAASPGDAQRKTPTCASSAQAERDEGTGGAEIVASAPAGAALELWPASPSQAKMLQQFRAFWAQKKKGPRV